MASVLQSSKLWTRLCRICGCIVCFPFQACTSRHWWLCGKIFGRLPSRSSFAKTEARTNSLKLSGHKRFEGYLFEATSLHCFWKSFVRKLMPSAVAWLQRAGVFFGREKGSGKSYNTLLGLARCHHCSVIGMMFDPLQPTKRCFKVLKIHLGWRNMVNVLPRSPLIACRRVCYKLFVP